MYGKRFTIGYKLGKEKFEKIEKKYVSILESHGFVQKNKVHLSEKTFSNIEYTQECNGSGDIENLLADLAKDVNVMSLDEDYDVSIS